MRATPITGAAGCIIAFTVALLAAACSNGPPPADAASERPQLSGPVVPTTDAATRTQPVVPGRPGRVFVFAGLSDACQPLAAPEITVATPPQKGDISFKPRQETTIAASTSGKCLETRATGTGVYYTARAGTTGTDSFALTARLASGETMTRTFSVTISE